MESKHRTLVDRAASVSIWAAVLWAVCWIGSFGDIVTGRGNPALKTMGLIGFSFLFRDAVLLWRDTRRLRKAIAAMKDIPRDSTGHPFGKPNERL